MSQEEAQKVVDDAKIFEGSMLIDSQPEKVIYEKYKLTKLFIQKEDDGDGYVPVGKFVSHTGKEIFFDARAIIDKFTIRRL